MEHPSGRRGGWTLIEVAFSAMIVAVILGSVAAVFSVMTQGTASAEMELFAQAESERAILAMVNDLQTTDTLGRDSSGAAYFAIADRAPGTKNSISFRKVEGFTADPTQDSVVSVFGTPIQFFIDADSNLIREKDGTRSTVANRISDLRFSADARGCISIEVTAFAGKGSGRIEAKESIGITPRNVQKL
jgi:type II secretory pathway pseudopilin PulG